MAEDQTRTDANGRQRFLTFAAGDRIYALPAAEVSEVIRLPPLARVPLGPKGLLGLANLRGAVLPIASLRGLLGEEPTEGGQSRAVVLDGPAAVAIAVDRVNALISIEPQEIEVEQAERSVQGGERLRGVFRIEGSERVAKILDITALLETAFTPRPRTARSVAAATALDTTHSDSELREKLVTFEVGAQEFALPLEVVREIVPAPEGVLLVPRVEEVVVGVMPYRDRLIPLMSLASLLGLGVASSGAAAKVVVVEVNGVLVGLLADKMRAILPADPELIEPTPPMLAARTRGETRITAIYRGDDGRRLVSILSPDHLFREDVMQKIGDGAMGEVDADPEAGEAIQILVFRLGNDEFGLPIEVVDEIAVAPEQVTRVPKTPKFLEGVINLRGEVLPVIDQRRRFDMPALASDRRRLIVVRTENRRAGLIVDSVSEVLRTTVEAIDAAPDLAGEPTRLVRGVINLASTSRMILLLDPAELLTRTEKGLLDAFQTESEQASS